MNDRDSHDRMKALATARDIAVLGCFGIWLLIPGVAQLCGFSTVDDIAAIEYRQPAPDPVMPQDLHGWRALPSAIEGYLNDHFGLRFQLGVMQSTLMAALGTSSSDQVLLGKQGWLFLSGGRLLDDFRGTAPVSGQTADTWVGNMLVVHESLERLGIAHVVTLIPNKWSVYPEHLPEWARPQGPTLYSILCGRMRDSGVPFVDARELILPQKAEGERRLFRKTDTHCTTRAGYIIYRQIMEVLARQRPQLTPLLPADLSIETQELMEPGDLHRFLHSTAILEEPPLTAFRVDSNRHKVLAAKVVAGNHWRDTTYGEALGLVWGAAYTSDAPNTVSALIYADSFTIPMQAFLINTFSEVVMVRHRKGVLDSDFITAVKPDVVLINLNEKALRKPLELTSVSPGLEELRW